jgi:hypothetical protein
VFLARYELGIFISKGGIFHSHRREKSRLLHLTLGRKHGVQILCSLIKTNESF